MGKIPLDKVINHFIELADVGGDGTLYAQEVAEGLLELKKRRDEDAQRVGQIPVSVPDAKNELIDSIDEVISTMGEGMKDSPNDEVKQVVYHTVAQILVGVQSNIINVFDRLTLVK